MPASKFYKAGHGLESAMERKNTNGFSREINRGPSAGQKERERKKTGQDARHGKTGRKGVRKRESVSS